MKMFHTAVNIALPCVITAITRIRDVPLETVVSGQAIKVHGMKDQIRQTVHAPRSSPPSFLLPRIVLLVLDHKEQNTKDIVATESVCVAKL